MLLVRRVRRVSSGHVSMSKKALPDESTAAGAGRSGEQRLPATVAALTIASHPDARRVGDRCFLDGLSAGKTVALGRNEPDFAGDGSALGAPIADSFVSRKPIRLS